MTPSSSSTGLQALSLALVLLLPACLTCEQLADEGSSLELGTGTAAFESIQEGEVLEAAWGSQGGQHVWSALRGSGLRGGSPDSPTEGTSDSAPSVHFEIFDVDGHYAQWGPAPHYLRRNAGEVETLGLTAFLSLSPDVVPWLWPDEIAQAEDPWSDWEALQEASLLMVEELEDRDLTFRVEVEDGCGTLLSDERQIRLSGVEFTAL